MSKHETYVAVLQTDRPGNSDDNALNCLNDIRDALGFGGRDSAEELREAILDGPAEEPWRKGTILRVTVEEVGPVETQ